MSRPRLSNFVMLKSKSVAGRKLKAGDRIPAGLLSAQKLKQLENWHICANVAEDIGQEEAAKRSHVFDKSE